jgi:hypothetical protein
MGQLRTANKRHKRAIRALQARDTSAKGGSVATVQPVKAAVR